MKHVKLVATSSRTILSCFPILHNMPTHATTFACAQTFLPSADQLQCVNCDATAGTATSFANGFLETSNWTAAAIASSGKCTCAAPTAQSVLSSVQGSGRYSSRCLTCEPGSTPDATNGVCTPPSGALPTAASDLTFVVDTLNAAPTNAGINKQTAVQVRCEDKTL